MNRPIKELEQYKGQKITIFHQAFGSGTFLGTLQNAIVEDNGDIVFYIIPYKCRKVKRINLMKTNFVVYEDYKHLYFARGGMGLPDYQYFKMINEYKYQILFKHCNINGVMYKGYPIIKENYNGKYTIMINDGGYQFDTIEDGKKYVDAFEIEEQKRIEEWRKRNKK